MTNYPDGAYDADPKAPWNRAEPWETETCGTCRWLREASVRGMRTTVCCEPDAMVVDVSRSSAACACWEAR